MACPQILNPILPAHFGKTTTFLNRHIMFRSPHRRSQHGLVRSKSDLDILMNTNLWETLTPPRSCSVSSSTTSTSTDACASQQDSMTSPCSSENVSPPTRKSETDVFSRERNQQQRKRSLPSIQSFTKRHCVTPSQESQTCIQTPNTNTNSTADTSSATTNTSALFTAVFVPHIHTQPQTVAPTTNMQHTTTTATTTTTTTTRFKKSSCLPLPRIKSAPARLTLRLTLPESTPPSLGVAANSASTMPRNRSKSLSERRGFKLMAIAMPCDVKNNEDTREDTATESQRDDLFTKATQLLKHGSSNSSESNSPVCNPCEMYQQLQSTLHPNVNTGDRKPSEWAAQELMQYMESTFAM